MSLVRYPTTLAPTSGSVTVTAQCADNAHIGRGSSLNVVCAFTGNWAGLVPQCQCDEGYQVAIRDGRERCQGLVKRFPLLRCMCAFPTAQPPTSVPCAVTECPDTSSNSPTECPPPAVCPTCPEPTHPLSPTPSDGPNHQSCPEHTHECPTTPCPECPTCPSSQSCHNSSPFQYPEVPTCPECPTCPDDPTCPNCPTSSLSSTTDIFHGQSIESTCVV